jgi:LPXTG-motif cell wall-anchored protein
MHATPLRRRIAAATITVGAVLVGVSLFAPSANAGGAPTRVYTTGFETYLNEGQLGTTADSKDDGQSCPTDESVAGLTAWHFVLEGSANDFEQLVVTFDIGGTQVERTYSSVVVAGGDLATFDWSTFDKDTEALSTPDGKHAYVYTGGGGSAVLVDAAANVSGADPSDKFQLSHTCAGEGTTDDGGDDGGDDGDVQATTGSQEPEAEVKGVVVLPQQLPATGDNDASMAIIGTTLVLIGGGILLVRRNLKPGS